MDERVVQIMKAAALGPLSHDDCDSYCVYCSALQESFLSTDGAVEVKIEHEAECPVILARAVLLEQGITPKEYRVAFEYRTSERGKQWKDAANSVTAFTAEEATQECTGERIRNVRVEFVRELGKW